MLFRSEGDILRKSNKFFRVSDFAKQSRDIVCNEILYNPKKDRLVLSHEYTYISWNDIGNYVVVKEDKKQVLEIVKRKYKLMKLDNNLK